jgi:hypothetical protein
MSSSSFVDSKAVFQGRARNIGISQTVIDDMDRRGWSTIAQFAYSTTFVPGAADDTSFVNAVLVPLLGAPDHISVPLIRRLFYESFTLMAAELKSRVDSNKNPEECTRRLADPERRVRFRQLESQVQGLVIRDEWEPAHALTDLFVEMAERNTLSYVPWEKCISRVTENAGIRKDSSWKDKPEVSLEAADYSSDFRIFQLLARRGMALHMAGLMSYMTHDKWVQIMLYELHRTQPKSHQQLTVEQLQLADVELWNRMSELVRDGIQPVGGVRPLETAFLRMIIAPEVRLTLMPLAKPFQREGKGQGKTHAQQQQQGGGKQQQGGGKQQQQQPQAAAVKKPSKNAKKKAKKTDRVLKYGSSVTPDGEEICFAYNGDGCSNSACTRKHVCQKCFANHPGRGCHKVARASE